MLYVCMMIYTYDASTSISHVRTGTTQAQEEGARSFFLRLRLCLWLCLFLRRMCKPQRICRSINCARGKGTLHYSKFYPDFHRDISRHGDERWTTEVSTYSPRHACAEHLQLRVAVCTSWASHVCWRPEQPPCFLMEAWTVFTSCRLLRIEMPQEADQPDQLLYSHFT